MTPGIHRILVATDFSEASDSAIDYAAALARQLSVSLYVIHVLDNLYPQGVWDFHLPETGETRSRHEQAVRSDLVKIAARVEQAGVHVTTDVREGSPADEIVTAARQFGADLIVMATHGRSGLPHLLLGSVAERVLRQANCPVLALRAAAAAPAGVVTHAVHAGTVA